MSIESLSSIRDRMMPMLEVAAEQYQGRVPAGYPNLIDSPAQGSFGLEIDPSYALFVTTDGAQTWVEMYRRNPRTDNRANAGYQKHGGLPFNDRRPLPVDVTDAGLRNLVAELMSHFNAQPNMIHITDD